MRDDDADDGFAFSGLHWLTAGLFVAAGAEAAFGARRGEYRRPDAIRWAPLVTAPVAGAAHVAQAVWPSSTTRVLTQVANSMAIGVGAAGLANSVYAALTEAGASDEERQSWLESMPSFAPLAFAAIGVLGLMLQDQEEDVDEEREQLKRRGRIVERFVPKRRARLDHIVVHV
ncbi:MAG: hypothetical protein WEE89_17805 [Gemmatimonadota bacterium]